MRDIFYQDIFMNMKNKYTVIFGGGGIRGLAYVGAMKALRELQIEIDNLAGSSVGAIFATFYAAGYTPDEVKEIIFDFNALMFKDINFTIGAEFAFSKGDVFENWVRDNLEKKFYGEKYQKGENPPVTFRNLEKNLYIYTTDLRTNTQFVFSKNNTPDFEIAKAVRISAGFPGLMKPVEYEDKLLVDGDLAKSLPFWECCSNDFLTPDSRILEFRLEGEKNNLCFKSVLDYFNAVYSTISNFSTENIIKTYKDKDNFDYILIDTKDILILDFQLSNELREQVSKDGYDTTIKYFKEFLPQKKQKLLPLYEKSLSKLLQLKEDIKKGNANSSKNVLEIYFCEFSEEYYNMDKLFLDDLKAFKEAFLNDIKKIGLLPLQKIENQTEHIKICQRLIETCENKISELKEYIK